MKRLPRLPSEAEALKDLAAAGSKSAKRTAANSRDPKALRVALENVKKWGRSALAEEEQDPDFPLVHEADLYVLGYVEEYDLDVERDDDDDPPLRLTPEGHRKLVELKSRMIA